MSYDTSISTEQRRKISLGITSKITHHYVKVPVLQNEYQWYVADASVIYTVVDMKVQLKPHPQKALTIFSQFRSWRTPCGY